MSGRSRLLGLPVVVLFAFPSLLTQGVQTPDQPTVSTTTAPEPNSDPAYRQLRNITFRGESAIAKDLMLKRDAGRFTFQSGNFFFLAPVGGKVTGAVFLGQGRFSLQPALEAEKHNLELLTKEPEMSEEFTEAVLRFTDGSEEEIKSRSSMQTAPVSAAATEALEGIRTTLRKNLQFNLDARILQDVLSGERGGLFAAFLKGSKYSRKELYIIDPHGVPGIAPKDLPGIRVAPEEVAFLTYEDRKFGVWAAFHFSEEYLAGKASGAQPNSAIHAEHHKLDTTIAKNGALSGTATTTFLARANKIRVVSLELFPTLRVESVIDGEGRPLSFIQENKDEDADFAVLLPRALAAGERYTITTRYSGRDAVRNEGGGNYYPVSRASWYPNTSFGDYATYEITFRIPKGLKMVGTGNKVRETEEGDQNISQWESEVPLAVAGFNFGRFKEEDAKLSGLGFTVEAYANLDQPDIVKRIQMLGPGTLGGMNTTSMMKKALGEAQLAIPLYTDYFGPLPYGRLAMTQQTAFNYGQSWPTLVYLPITSFFDSTTRHQLGLDDTHGFFKAVGPHEVAHQWWGHTVGFNSYRDQWMSEGFAEFSASLFLQAFYKDEFGKFWDHQRDQLTQKNKEGFRAIEVGPVTMGYRAASTRTGFDLAGRLIYPKGAYILHMIRMMMWDVQSGDQRFKEMMKEFVKTYSNCPATTEDFKAIVEKHMVPTMNLAGNGKMDWFFNEYVYGTALPSYHFDYSFPTGPDGAIMLNLKIVQSDVDDSFIMTVPVDLELSGGRLFRIGMVPMKGNQTFAKQIALRGLKEKPKRAMLSYFSDVLSAK